MDPRTAVIYLYTALAELFLGAFPKLRKSTISLVMSVCPSVRMEYLGCHWTDFHEILYLGIFFSKVFRENSSFTKNWQE